MPPLLAAVANQNAGTMLSTLIVPRAWGQHVDRCFRLGEVDVMGNGYEWDSVELPSEPASSPWLSLLDSFLFINPLLSSSIVEFQSFSPPAPTLLT